MQSDDSRTQAECANKPEPLFKVDRVSFEQIRRSIVPISLNINCQAAQQNALSQCGSAFSYQYFLKELKLWSRYLKCRPVHRLWINDPFCIMDAPNLTELVHTIGQHFRLSRGNQKEYAAVLSCQSATREHIALLKGLEFNHIQLYLLPHCSLEEAIALRNCINDFKFSYMSLRFDKLFVTQDTNLTRQIELIKTLSPDAIFLPSQPKSQPALAEHLLNALHPPSYELEWPSQLVRPSNRLPLCPQDIIAIGPGERSVIGRVPITNTLDYLEYSRRLHFNLLPFISEST